MNRLLTFLVLLAVCAAVLPPGAQAQITGDVVEYFGRDTVEEIEEGNVVHVFSRGLFIPVRRTTTGLFSNSDPMIWKMATGRYQTPYEGQAPYERFPDLAWETVEINDNDYFQSPRLRGAYVYTSIELDEPETVLLDARGHTRVYINGLPYEGDHYDFGYTLIPVTLQRGLNEFIYTPGRFGRVSSRLVAPSTPVQLTRRDMTLPSLMVGETDEKWGAIRLVNASDRDIEGHTITTVLQSGERASYQAGRVLAMSVRKLPFRIPEAPNTSESGRLTADVILTDAAGNEVHRVEITLNVHTPRQHHERTFVSRIDGSVQYYSVAPSTSDDDGQGLVLSVHGAGVEATNQSRAYRSKDWAHVVAATNRRPYGFNWEEWGRIDGMEVYEHAMQLYRTAPERSYLTGHSMGGHGTWHLGVTYPDKFAAIAPAAGYADIMGYGSRRMPESLEENRNFQMVRRASNAGRTVELKRNYLQSGVYIYHGSDDLVVSVEQARYMRGILGEFHPNFVHYEYPGGSHWYGNHSVDWGPIFDYFKWQTIPADNEVTELEFHTATPAISAENHWIRINQQQVPFDFSHVHFVVEDDSIKGSVENVEHLTFFLSRLDLENDPVVVIDETEIQAQRGTDLTVRHNGEGWMVTELNMAEKHPARSGGFKHAFDNYMVFVYATYGSAEENEWYKNKARFDAETFQYRGNGSIEIVADRDFRPEAFADRNVILYGNQSNNSAWSRVLDNAPVVVRDGEIRVGDRRVYKGNDLGALYILPRAGSDTASVGIVAGTGVPGMKAAFANDYFSGVTGFPDLMIFSVDMLRDGLDGVIMSGFFGNDWSIENGDFSY